MKGTTPSALADSMHRSRMLVSNVIHGRAVSRPVADTIARLLGYRADQLWPGKYKVVEGAFVDRRATDRRAGDRRAGDRRVAKVGA